MINIEGDSATIIVSVKMPIIGTAGTITGYTLTDPSGLTLTTVDPAAAENAYVFGTDAEITKVSTGVYQIQFSVPDAGEWILKVVATAPDIYDELHFIVGESLSWTTVPPLADYESFIGEEASMYATEALIQATLLMQLATDLTAKPTAATDLEVYKYGIYAMAEAIDKTKETRSVAIAPFRAEQIGSYRYDKVAGSILKGMPTGVMWFDVAVQRLRNITDTLGFSTGTTFMEDDSMDVLHYKNSITGRKILYGPADIGEESLDRYKHGWTPYGVK